MGNNGENSVRILWPGPLINRETHFTERFIFTEMLYSKVGKIDLSGTTDTGNVPRPGDVYNTHC